MITLYLEKQSLLRILLVPMLFAWLPVIMWAARLTGENTWLQVAVLPLAVAASLLGSAGQVLVLFLALVFFGYVDFFWVEAGDPQAFWFHFLALGLSWTTLLLFRHRARGEERVDRDDHSALEERLILAREQYKTDLVLNVSNQKKIQKYFLLNRISRIFGSQLELSKLADAIIRELRDIIGAERGSYMLAYFLPGGDKPMVRSFPQGTEVEKIVDDQFGIWASQHRTTLLVTDTAKDFRFRTEPGEGQLRSLMIAPLLVEGRVTGILRAESVYQGMFTPDDLRLFTIMADLASAAAENARLYQRTQELAITDGLTGLYLRRFFNQRLEEELSRYAEHATPFTLMILDLDLFKRVNDRLGHLAGDQVLVQLSEILRGEARITDILCRFGGEEFALLLPSTPPASGLIMAERIRVHVNQKPFMVFQENVSLSVSIGLAGCPEHGREANELVKAADEALYTAKREGRNRVVLSGSSA